jgi:hypothetical protein
MITSVPVVASANAEAQESSLLTRRQRAHWRLSWTERLARNACSKQEPSIELHLFGIPTTVATSLGLAVVEGDTGSSNV